MRQEKTLKICANHYVIEPMALKPHAGSERAFVWRAPQDFADGEPKDETLAIRLSSAEDAKEFNEAFIKAVNTNTALANGGTPEPVEAAEEKKDDAPEDKEEAKAEEEKKDE
jgi:Ran-binding protein 1